MSKVYQKYQQPTVFVLFGITGDLAKKKIIPSLFELYLHGALPASFQVLGVSRRIQNDGSLRSIVKATLPRSATRNHKEKFSKHFRIVQGDVENGETFTKLAKLLGRRENGWGSCANRLFYLAVPPSQFSNILDQLKKSQLTDACSDKEGYSRILIEKPFGEDLESAKKLDQKLQRLLRDEQIFRIDHYLTKETLQNILTFRFSNSFFQPLWNAGSITQIHVRLLEKNTADSRGSFYDHVGAIRDVGQNHLLQMLALTIMDRPKSMEVNDVRGERKKVLEDLFFPSAKELKNIFIRGQYQSYRATKGVQKGSKTETYFRTLLHSRNAKWKGIPFILESGKGFKEDRSEIEITFNHPMQCFCENMHPNSDGNPNVLTFHLKPQSGISITFLAKKPGLTLEAEPRTMSFDYLEGGRHDEEAYVKVLYDALTGDQMLFASNDEVFAAWKLTEPLARYAARTKLHTYKKGSMPPIINGGKS